MKTAEHWAPVTQEPQRDLPARRSDDGALCRVVSARAWILRGTQCLDPAACLHKTQHAGTCSLALSGTQQRPDCASGRVT